ncbi:MAG: hypothetical protein WAK03_10200 [Methylocystis sp.]|jgi:hypothetical protein
MADYLHAIVWIDHREAKIFLFNATEVDRMMLHPHDPSRHILYNASKEGKDDTPSKDAFLEQVSAEICDGKAILITGPSNETSELAAHLRRHHLNIASFVVGIETIDHPSNGALIAVARLFFTAEDRSPSQT